MDQKLEYMNRSQQRFRLYQGSFVKQEGNDIISNSPNSYSTFFLVEFVELDQGLGLGMVLEINTAYFLDNVITRPNIRKYIPQSTILRGVTGLYYIMTKIHSQKIEAASYHYHQFPCLTITRESLEKLQGDYHIKQRFIHRDFMWYDIMTKL